MTYRILPEPHRAIADAAAKFLRIDRGLRAFKIEEPIADGVDRPTLHTIAQDHHFVCVEVSERNGLQPNVESFIGDCGRASLPVKLFVAVSAGEVDSKFDKMVARAKVLGVGVLEVDGASVVVRGEPLSLSLQAVRRVDRKSFPAKYRDPLAQAENMFLSGNPVKGCSAVYDEIEALSRKLADHTYQACLWKTHTPMTNPIKMKISTHAWAPVMKQFLSELDGAKLPSVPEPLIASIIGVTPHRNATGHKVSKPKDMIKRDKQLRTRFEHGVDVLQDLIHAAKPFKL